MVKYSEKWRGVNLVSIAIVEGLPTIEEYKFLRSSVGWQLIDENAMRKGINTSVYSLLAKAGDKTVGMGRIVGDGGIIYLLADIIILPEFQKQGIGHMIVQNLMDWLRNNCAKGCLVWLFAAEGKESFYKKVGFEKRPAPGYGAGMQWFWKNSL